MISRCTYRVKDGERIEGIFFLAFIHNVDYYLYPISVYQDGMIDCWGLVDFDEFCEKVRSGWVVTQPPEGAQIGISLLGRFTTANASFYIEPEELLKDVADHIELLNGRPGASALCRKAFENFVKSPSREGKEVLRQTYEAMPAHKRCFVLGDMDAKDFPIRVILYGKEEIENWSHRQVARRFGIDPLPTITVPDIPDEE